MKDLIGFFFAIIYGIVYLNLYTSLISYNNFIFFFSPELIFLYGFIGIFIYGLFKKMSSYDCILSYCIMLYMVIKQYIIILKSEVNINSEFWFVDEKTIYIKIIILISAFIVMLFMYWLEDKDSELHLNFELYILILLCILGLLILMISNNFFVLYLGIELQSLAIYILCCLKRYSNKSVEAGLKYFIYGSYASLILLLGISYIYLLFGTLNFNDVNLLINILDLDNYILLHISLICILIGFFFKLAIAPFHWWLAEIFEGSPDLITFFLAIVPKMPLFFLLYKIYNLFYAYFMIYFYIFLICSLLSIIIGTILALYAVKLKKLFAYSSIVHMGYILLALSLNLNISVAVSFYYFLIYILSTINLFSIYLLIKNTQVVVSGNITDLSYLKNSNKLLALIAIVSLLSLAGVPPFMGFYGKLLVFNLLISSGNYIICLLLLLLSILSCVYYIRLVRFIFFDDKNNEPITFQKKKTMYMYIFIVILFFLNLVFLFFQEPLLLYIIFLFS